MIRYRGDQGGEPDQRGSSVPLSLDVLRMYEEGLYACERAIGWGYRGMSAVDLI